jgi:hypothetical protein
MYREVLSVRTADDLKPLLRDGQRLQIEAQRRGWIEPQEAERVEYSDIKRGSDGLLYGKNSITQRYERIPSPEGVTFDSTSQQINVNTQPQQPTGAFFTTQVEGANQTLNQFREAANAARSRLPAIRSLKSMDIETGFGTRARTAMARMTNFLFGEGAGDVFSDEVPTAETFQALSQKMVNEELNLAKGPQTEGDAIRARQTVASLDKAPEANKFLLSYYEGLALREAERNQFFESRMNTGPNQTDEEGLVNFRQAEQEWLEYKNRTPLVATRQNDGKVLTYAGTRIPMVYYDFEKLFMQRNADNLQGMSMKEKRQAAQQAWRDANGL